MIMKNFLLLLLFFLFNIQAQEKLLINKQEVKRIITELASDKMEGRATFSPGIQRASAFIENEFKTIGLSFYGKLKSYKQSFKKEGKALNNVVGIIRGKKKPNEIVIFSAHYDHLGIKGTVGDTIFNGANDDASGVAAVIALANYFKKQNLNERTLLFIAFTGEELGGFGSSYFSENSTTKQIVAMFNIEMIGTESMWGKNSAFITGFEKTNFGKILQKNLKNSRFNFYPDPYPEQDLFYRSDNATLAKFGVPAHTISTSKMDSEPHYHQLDDEIETLDIDNMTEIITSIALSSNSIISGSDTPTRNKKE
jgi:Zn-dependent M28 family amino/carboxypeptidase